ncbi:MAG: FAD-dependent monooxygenase [Pigmentiphaga sp.]|nr:FAD-dependent monooxygenase [Pigmentiphaga sp.]
MEAALTLFGAGPVSLTLALLLARHAPDPARIVVCQSAQTTSGLDDDPRAIALNHGSEMLLRQLHAWPERGTPIQHVHVSQQGRLGRALISHQDFSVPQLGTVVAYTDLVQALRQAIEHSGITVLSGSPPEVLANHGTHSLLKQDGHTFTSRFCVHAEGGTYDKQAVQDWRRDYQQHAVLTLVQASRPKPGWAYERFTREGPLALLPYHDGPQGQRGRYSLVWCCTPERAAALTALPPSAFADALQHVFGDRLGQLSTPNPRQTFPLGLNARRQLVWQNHVYIGNAAQTLHPVAGQGLNLGLRDAAQLAQSLRGRLDTAAPETLLSDYARKRRTDRLLTLGVTDFLPRAFATRLPVVEHAAGLALLGMDLSRRLRGPLAQHLLSGLRE